MIFAQKEKRVVLVHESMTAAGTAQGIVDTRGWSYAMIDIALNFNSAPTNNPSVLKVSEGDTSTAFTVIDELEGDGTNGGFTIPAVVSAATAGASVVALGIDLRTRKRYLCLDITNVPAAAAMSAVCRLSRGETAPDTDAESGCAERVNI